VTGLLVESGEKVVEEMDELVKFVSFFPVCLIVRDCKYTFLRFSSSRFWDILLGSLSCVDIRRGVRLNRNLWASLRQLTIGVSSSPRLA